MPETHRVNPEVGEAKSQAGRRVVGLPEELVQLLLVAHRSMPGRAEDHGSPVYGRKAAGCSPRRWASR